MVLSMDRWKDKVAIVTGASSGIGAAIAVALVEAGMKVIGLARRKEKIEELASKLKNKTGQLYAVKCDITKEEDILNAFQWVKDNVGLVHILINNAGVGRSTNLVEGDTQMWREVMDTNVLGLCIATREAVKIMRENRIDGHVVHINSILGQKVSYFPTVNVLAASKRAVTALTETLRQELNSIGSKIKITSISPGAVTSEFREAGGWSAVAEQEKILQAAPHLQPEDVSDGVIYVLSTPPHVQVHELTIKPVGESF